MEIEAITSTVATPRIDLNFVEPGTGKLTQNAYALLYQLIRRTGGVVSEVIDPAAIRVSINGLSDDVLSIQTAPLPADAAPAPADDDEHGRMESIEAEMSVLHSADNPHGRIEALEAEMSALRSAINDLQQGTTP